jgi:bifunctional DNA-binding transcriptional regulator/antitoxin component of YhaV-PrlF toxin-antitoxin module
MIVDQKKGKEITKTWISGQNSCTLIIPKSVAKEYGLESPTHVVVERTDKGILIRKLEILEQGK